MGQVFDAIKDYDQATKIAPQNPKYHHAKGIAYENLASKIEKEHTKFERFNDEELPVDQRCSDSLSCYLR